MANNKNKCMFCNTIMSEDEQDQVSFCMFPNKEWEECPGNCILTPEQIFSIIHVSKQEEQQCQKIITVK